MKKWIVPAVAILLLVAGGCGKGRPLSAEKRGKSEEEMIRALAEIQNSHIDANVPEVADFDKILKQDLAKYFARPGEQASVSVEYELLRDGPTQSGVAYPKFYAWVRVAGGKTPNDRGAVRLAAIEKKRFEITDFVTESEIRKAPDRIHMIFPGPVCERILKQVK